MNPIPTSGGASADPMILALDLVIAQLAATGTRSDRLRLHADLQPVAAQYPAMAAAMRSLFENRPIAERWRAYARAEAAAADWVDAHAVTPARPAAGAARLQPHRPRTGR